MSSAKPWSSSATAGFNCFSSLKVESHHRTWFDRWSSSEQHFLSPDFHYFAAKRDLKGICWENTRSVFLKILIRFFICFFVFLFNRFFEIWKACVEIFLLCNLFLPLLGGRQEHELPYGNALHKGDGEDGELMVMVVVMVLMVAIVVMMVREASLKSLFCTRCRCG